MARAASAAAPQPTAPVPTSSRRPAGHDQDSTLVRVPTTTTTTTSTEKPPSLHRWSQEENMVLAVLYQFTNLSWPDIFQRMTQEFRDGAPTIPSMQMHWQAIAAKMKKAAPRPDASSARGPSSSNPYPTFDDVASLSIDAPVVADILGQWKLTPEPRNRQPRHWWTDEEYQTLALFRLFSHASWRLVTQAMNRCFHLQLSSNTMYGRWQKLVRNQPETLETARELGVAHPEEVTSVLAQYGLPSQLDPRVVEPLNPLFVVPRDAPGPAPARPQPLPDHIARRYRGPRLLPRRPNPETAWHYTVENDEFMGWYRTHTNISWKQLTMIFNHQFDATVPVLSTANRLLSRYQKIKERENLVGFHMASHAQLASGNQSGWGLGLNPLGQSYPWADLHFFDAFWAEVLHGPGADLQRRQSQAGDGRKQQQRQRGGHTHGEGRDAEAAGTSKWPALARPEVPPYRLKLDLPAIRHGTVSSLSNREPDPDGNDGDDDDAGLKFRPRRPLAMSISSMLNPLP
ncbi:MAG: hypothetical protein M1838_002455 [Thelocarpon superellum]|nr:MAG: hypothetical protein M1838_002455 [Thelocarpon superellum]